MHILALILLAGPFYLNDFASILVKDWRWWLAIDFVAVKLFPIGVAAWLIRNRKMTAADFGLTVQGTSPFFAVYFSLTIVGTIIDQNAYALMAGLPGYPPLGAMPAITSPVWNRVDLTLGLLLVGVVEELVFRGYMHTLIRRYTEKGWVVVAVSAAAFGLIHWSLGLHAVVVTAAVGAIFMAVYMRTRSLPAIMLAHFTINFIDFAGVIPKSIFRLV